MEDNTSKEKANNRNVYVIELLVSEVKMAREERKQIKAELNCIKYMLSRIFFITIIVSNINISYKISWLLGCLLIDSIHYINNKKQGK